MPKWKADRLYHGGDYNPDQWLDYPEILEQDIEYMKKAGINCVSLGIFAWAHLEPEEGRYELAWLRKIIDNLYENGIYTILATPSGAKPLWLAHKYEEVCRVNRHGQRELPGHRHNHCYTSPVYREKTAQINARLAREFNNHPAVILWHLSNEYGGECLCPLCEEAFRQWLRAKYETLDKLNHEWWTHFWSHTYTAWEQIRAPFDHGENGLHGLNLDWKRFVTDQTVDFMKAEIKALRDAGSELPVTTNMMGFYGGLNYSKFAEHLDVVSWDNYPLWHSDKDGELSVAVYSALTHDLMRGIKREPFLLMESTPSVTNWSQVSKLKRCRMHTLSSVQAVAHGSDSVQYFQWRKSRGSSEKFHGAVVSHDCSDEHSVFKAVKTVGEWLAGYKELAGTQIKPEVAIIFDQENRWALEDAKGPRNCGMHYIETIYDHYRPFWEMGINVDVIDMEKDLTGYKLVIAPMLYMYRAGIAGKMKKFVENGGTLVGTYRSGIVNENDLCFLGKCPGEGMNEVFGRYSDEIDALYDGEFNRTHYPINGAGDKYNYRLIELCELGRAEGAEILSEYCDDDYSCLPVLTRNNYGQGTAYYLAARPDETVKLNGEIKELSDQDLNIEPTLLRVFYGELADELKLRPDITNKLPYGTTVSKRYGNGKTYWIFQNFINREVKVKLNCPCKEIAYDNPPADEWNAPGYAVSVMVT